MFAGPRWLPGGVARAAFITLSPHNPSVARRPNRGFLILTMATVDHEPQQFALGGRNDLA
jgi:hypothetical protein